jgi:uncharacterized protein YbbK (DUF523 family)
MAGKVMVSACLLGLNCRFDGSNCLDKELISLFKKRKIVFVGLCPEELGGLLGERGPFEIEGKTKEFWKNKAKVIDRNKKDFTRYFKKGARLVLKIVREANIKSAILKSKSSSCAANFVYDGSFKKKLRKDLGVCAYILKKNKIKIFDSNEFKRRFKNYSSAI